MPFGWAIVSTGRHPDHKMAPAINAAEGSEIAAVVSRDRKRAEEFAAKHGARAAFDDFDEMLRNPSVDALYIASPNSLHAEQTVKAAQAGKHVLCEKPMALTVEDCQRMIDACRAADVRLGVGFHLRAHRGHQRLRELVTNGSLGTIALAQAQFGGGPRGQVKPPPRPPLQQWWEDPELAGAGAFMGTGVHAVDLLRYALDSEVTEVAALNDATAEEPLEHLVTMALRFANGSLGTLVSSRRLPDSRNDIVVYGSLGRGGVHGSLLVDYRGRLVVTTDALSADEEFGPDPIALYTAQVEAFAEAAQKGSDPLATGEDGLKAAAVTIAMVESARTGRRVTLA